MAHHDDINFKDLEQYVQVDEENGIRIGEIYVPPPPLESCTFEAAESRLIIFQIENENFKSYAGKHILGPFHKNLTAIVGPNGSGKSNVIDSMLFVFGYRAQKIRSKKVSVLIHNSDQYPNIEYCSVSIYFHKISDKSRDEFEVVPDTEFKVTRTAFKDNSSHYSINDKRVQFSQVAQLLRSHGIDLDHNRFLILQGEVEQIALMKPKATGEHDSGMLEFVEDIVGTTRYKEPLDLLSKKVEEICEQRIEKVNRVRVVEKELSELEEFKNEALKYVNIENSIAQAKNALYQKNKLINVKQKEEAVQKRDAILEKKKELQKSLDEAKNSKGTKEAELKALVKKRDHYAKIFEERKEQFEAMERQDFTCRENLRHAKTKVKKLEKDLDLEKHKVSELATQPETFQREIGELQEQKSKLEAEKKEKEKMLSEVMATIQVETKGLQEEKTRYQNELLEHNKSLNGAKSKMDLAKSELDILLSTKEKETARLDKLQKDYESVVSSAQNAKEEIEEVKLKIGKAETLYAQTKANLATVSEEEQRLAPEVKTKRHRMEECRSRMQATRSRGKVLDALMAEKSSGRLPGIFGRLGDLGAIDPKYDVAISTACGPLDNIVTDTITTAQRCVEFLKRTKTGQATFIALDKMDRWIPHTKKKIPTPENVPRLFDLIKVADERVRPAFYFSLQDTLVADNLEQATRIGLQGRIRYRVVTLKGELIDLSGTMSGGGTRVSRGRMGTKVSNLDTSFTEDIDQMAEDFNRLSQHYEEICKQRANLEAAYSSQVKELDSLTHRRNRLELDIKALTTQNSTLKQSLADQEKKVKASVPDSNVVKQMEKKLKETEAVYSKESELASEIELKVQGVHNKIVGITEKKIGNVQQQLNAIIAQIDKVASGITKDGVALKTALRNKKKAEDKAANIEREMSDCHKVMEKCREELKKLQEDAEKVQNDKIESEEKKAKCEEQLKGMSKELKEFSEKESSFNREFVEVKNELDKWEARVKDLSTKVKQWAQMLSKVSLHLLEGEAEVPPLAELTEEELDKVDSAALQEEIAAQEQVLSSMEPNMSAIAEYRRKEKILAERQEELNLVNRERDTQRSILDRLTKRRLSEFMHGFHIIASKLKEMYQMITLGGDAELELVDSMDPFGGGITFSVRPPKKSWKNITNLSGGEKTLSSLALVFALHYYRPTPIYFMDEIDAALDFRNVSIVANYIKERTKNAQFIIISLRNNMFELADRLVGIYKTYNCTKSVTIDPAKIAMATTSSAPAPISAC